MEQIQGVLPAVKNMKDFEKLLKSESRYIILLETRLSQVINLVKYAREAQKKILIHVDLIQGLKADLYGMEFLIHEAKVNGIISTRSNIISIAKKNKLLAIQRLFALDSHALDNNLELIRKTKPDYIEVLPGLMPKILKEVNQATGIPVIAGGLIRDEEDVHQALEGGAVAVTTSRSELWRVEK